MSIFKRGRKYWFEFVFEGQRIRRSTQQSNRQAAKDIESAYRTKLAKGEVGIEERKTIPTFAQFEENFRREMQTLHASKPKTVTYYENSLDRLLEFEPMKNARLDKVDEGLIAQYVTKRRGVKKPNGMPLKVATCNRELEVLRRMLRLAQEWKVIRSVPKISRLPGEVQRDRVLTHEEEQSYLAAACPLLRDVATVLVDSGLRPEECFRLTWSNVHFSPAGKGATYGFAYIPEGKTKFARRNVPLTQRTKALLEMRHESQGRPLDGWVFPANTKSGRVESLKSQHRTTLKLCFVKAFVLYSLRHTMLTRLGEAGADAFSIQRIAGHSSVAISQRYQHPTGERIEAAFTMLEGYNARKAEELKKEQGKRNEILQ